MTEIQSVTISKKPKFLKKILVMLAVVVAKKLIYKFLSGKKIPALINFSPTATNKLVINIGGRKKR